MITTLSNNLKNMWMLVCRFCHFYLIMLLLKNRVAMVFLILLLIFLQALNIFSTCCLSLIFELIITHARGINFRFWLAPAALSSSSEFYFVVFSPLSKCVCLSLGEGYAIDFSVLKKKINAPSDFFCI